MVEMKGSVPQQDLWRMTYNLLQYSQKKSLCKGETLWIRGGTSLRAVACDDYVGITDLVDQLPMDSPKFLMMELDILQTFEKDLRGQEGTFELLGLPGDAVDPGNGPSLIGLEGLQTMSLLNQADMMAYAENYAEPISIETFALHPDRLRKLSLIKGVASGKKYPIDVRFFKDEDSVLQLSFRLGPTVRGWMVPMDRTTLKELYDGEEIW